MRQVYIRFSVPKYEGHALDPIRNLYHLLSTGQYTLSLIYSCSLYLFFKLIMDFGGKVPPQKNRYAKIYINTSIISRIIKTTLLHCIDCLQSFATAPTHIVCFFYLAI